MLSSTHGAFCRDEFKTGEEVCGFLALVCWLGRHWVLWKGDYGSYG